MAKYQDYYTFIFAKIKKHCVILVTLEQNI